MVVSRLFLQIPTTRDIRVERNHLSTNILHKPRAAKGEHVVQASHYISTCYAPRSKNRAARNMHTAKG